MQTYPFWEPALRKRPLVPCVGVSRGASPGGPASPSRGSSVAPQRGRGSCLVLPGVVACAVGNSGRWVSGFAGASPSCIRGGQSARGHPALGGEHPRRQGCPVLVFNSVHCAHCPCVSLDPKGPRLLLNVLCHVRVWELPGPLFSSSPLISHEHLGGSW